VPGAGAEYDNGMVRPDLAHRGSAHQEPHHHQRQQRLATWAALLIPGILLLLVDGYDLGRVSLWRDEAYTVDAAHRSLPQIFAMLRHTDAVNSAYYLVMHVDIALLGTSETALRLPALLGMAVAAVATAAIGRRLALASRLPAPAMTGMVAGLLLVAAPQVTRYAQEARVYGLVTMCVTVAVYLLLRAVADGRWRWWLAYGAVIALAGLFNLITLLVIVPHALTLWIARARQRAAVPADSPAAGSPAGLGVPVRMSRWLAVVAAAVVVASPLVALGYQQRRQASWLVRPGLPAVSNLAVAFAGSTVLLAVIAVVALAGVLGCLSGQPRMPVDAVTLALPWLVLPTAILFVISQIHPLYDTRYVVYTLPALSLLTATGLAWLTRLVASGPFGRAYPALAWLPAALVLAGLAALLLAPQRSIRLASARTDNLRRTSAIVSANERPGDAVLYLPANKRVFSMGYPAPFRQLWDISLAKSPVAADNLIGTEVPVSTLRARFARVTRVWVVSGSSGLRMLQHPAGARQRAVVALLRRFHLIRRWRVAWDVLSLYARG
jgi:mannosyltransferase